MIAAALDRGDLAMAAIAAVQLQFPDPPPLAKGAESHADIERRAVELYRSGLLKFWDPAIHPRAGTPPNPGWFALVGAGDEASTVVLVGDHRHHPHDEGHPEEEGHSLTLGEGRGPAGPLEIEPALPLGLPFPRLGPRPSGTAVPAKPPSPAPRPASPPEPRPELPFPEGLPSQRAPGASTQGDFEGVPAHGGRLGNPPVRAQNAEIAAKLKDQGFRITGGGGVTKEEYIPPRRSRGPRHLCRHHGCERANG